MSNSPTIILVHPQLVENIGMTARAMANCGLTDLRIVNPRDPWPLGEVHQARMEGAASGATDILAAAQLFDNLEDALADLNYVYATTARSNDMVTRIMTPRAASTDMRERTLEGQKVGVMFGPERTGLFNDHIMLASAKITIPLNPEFTSLNLAQAVLLVGYEWYQSGDAATATAPMFTRHGRSFPASRAEYLNFFNRLERELDDAGFFVAENMRQSMTQSLHNMLQRAEMTDQEVRTWHGVLTALCTGLKRRNTRSEDGGDE